MAHLFAMRLGVTLLRFEVNSNMIEFSFLLHDLENDAGELSIQVSFDGFSGRMSRFAGRAGLVNFASNIKSANRFQGDANIVYTTVFDDIPLCEQPQAQCIVALSKFGPKNGVVINASIQDETILSVGARRPASTRVSFVSTLEEVFKFADDIDRFRTSDQFTVAIRPSHNLEGYEMPLIP